MTTPRSRLLALSLAGLVGSLVLVGCGDDTEPVASDPGSSEEPTSTPTEPESSEPAPSTPVPSESPGAGETVTVPVYFVGDTPQGQRLYREFRKVGADDPLTEAAALMAAGDAQDPDYGTLYPGGGFAAVTYADGGFVVELADAAYTAAPQGMTKEQATLAAQQLVYTLQGAQQKREPVTVELDGAPTTLFGVDTAAGLTQAPQLDVLALVSITAPEEGATVSGTVTASGVASSFEATVPWEIRRGKQVVLKGFATAEGWMDKLYPWQTEVDVSGLAPGEYTFAVRTDDPSGGEGFGPTEDTRTITVQ